MRAAYNAHEIWASIEIANRESNDPVSVVGETDDDGLIKQFTVSIGRPADIVHNGGATVGANELLDQTNHTRIDDIFVHAGDLKALTGCSLETGRRWLERFHEHGLLEQHGDVSTQDDDETYSVHLYLPRRIDRETVMRTLYKLDNRSSPETLEDLTPVTPGDFQHVEHGVWQYTADAEVTVDVTEPDQSGISIQDHVKSQLRPHGLKPSSANNFVYQLRKKSGLV